MATVFSNVNIAHMNTKQLRKIATDVNVNPVTINANVLDSVPARKTALIAAIKAK